MLIKGRKLLGKIGIDGAIAFTLITRIVQAAGGLVSVIFIARFLSADEQGYYYTFTSILALQVFFELGLSGIITQYTAHEFAHLKWINNSLAGDDYYKSRLSSLLTFFLKWFGIVSIVLFLILLIAGFYFFSSYNKDAVIDWQNPWIILCLATSLNLFIDPILAFIEGLGEVKDMAKLRLVQKSINVCLLFLLFSFGFRLYSAALASLISVSINYVQLLFSARREKLVAIWHALKDARINYMTEIFPFQWRIALSWIGGYFIFQLFNPVLFAFDGPVAAGQMGMTLQVLNGISALSMSWITTKVPLFSSLIALKSFGDLDEIFKKTIKSLLFVNGSLVVAFYLFYSVLNHFDLKISHRFLPALPLLLLCLVTFTNQLIFSWATYLRCHKKEPFLVNTLVIGVFCGASTLLLGKYYGMNGIVGGYSFITIFLSLPWAYRIFKTSKYLWH